ncbi:MAG: NADH:flavin oxidoreductase/NADH oxidase [Actinomycetales bacterium]|nr:NADH:flavin oxidoreductase/NADH oxidase [Actinomycetales bacterium]
MSLLFEPMTLRETQFANRAWVAPMCQYSADGGLVGDWHLAHLGSLATGGFGLVVAEATAVVAEGRISPRDAGLWHESHVEAWRRITSFVHERGTLLGVQLAHAGRKASTYWPWHERSGTVPFEDGGWGTRGPSAVPFPGYVPPAEVTPEDIAALPELFAAAARRALAAGFDVVEVHAAHGYLLHEFLSPLSNVRTDEYGGSLENRMRLPLEVTRAVREAWPEERALLVRISATDWVTGGLTVDESVELAKELAVAGADLVDVSTGGNVLADIPVGPGYQVPAARAVREGAGVPVSAVGLITDPLQAEQVLVDQAADAVMLGRAALREPRWALRAAHELGDARGTWQPQYERARL